MLWPHLQEAFLNTNARFKKGVLENQPYYHPAQSLWQGILPQLELGPQVSLLVQVDRLARARLELACKK